MEFLYLPVSVANIHVSSTKKGIIFLKQSTELSQPELRFLELGPLQRTTLFHFAIYTLPHLHGTSSLTPGNSTATQSFLIHSKTFCTLSGIHAFPVAE